MPETTSRTTLTARPDARVVDLAAYRAARAREDDVLPLFALPLGDGGHPESTPGVRALSERAVAHRERMLRHLATAPDRM